MAAGVMAMAVAALTRTLMGGADTTEEAPLPRDDVVALIASSAPNRNLLATQFCGGVLIAPQLVLTAAHCVSRRAADSIHIVFGADNLCDTMPAGGGRIGVAKITLHPSYDAESGRYDAATLLLEKALLNEQTTPITKAVGPTDAVAFGWGGFEGGGAGSCRLIAKRLKLLSAQSVHRRAVWRARI